MCVEKCVSFKENDELRRQDKENKIQIEVLEVMQGSLAKKNNSNEKVDQQHALQCAVPAAIKAVEFATHSKSCYVK